MTRKLYIKPEATVTEIKESIALLAGSGENADMTSTEYEVNFQSKRHNSWSMNDGDNNAYNPWTTWDD